VKIALVRSSERRFGALLARILARRGTSDRGLERRVGAILDAVRREGDRALLRFARRWDRVRLGRRDLEVPRSEIERAAASLSREDRRALELAARRIADFHARQRQRSWEYRDALGLRLGQRLAPLERVGLYVPGGKAAYPSTVLMNAIPARLAGVAEIVMASPVYRDGAAVLAAAKIAGVARVFRVGGAQAVAALAYGTESIPRVDKIVGPGNVFVATAKRLVFGEVDIDSVAGPSEILILADESADPAYIAIDMLSQAEHDELAAAFCVTPSLRLAREVERCLAREIEATERQAIALRALARYGAIIVTRDLAEAAEIANRVAPEHVELMVRRPRRFAARIRNAGAIFIGPYATPPLGDYLAGPNHVLPTGGSARFFSPLGTYDFVKRTSIIEASRAGLRSLAPGVVRLARLEGLFDHARAVEARFREEAS
jgi:histidinol dehydrogenase